MVKYKYIFQIKYTEAGSNFIKQHTEAVMVWNYQNADCSFKNKFIVSFIVNYYFGTLSSPLLHQSRTDLQFFYLESYQQIWASTLGK